jgi:hypothetical protein
VKASEVKRIAKKAERTFRAVNDTPAHVPVKVTLRVAGRWVDVPINVKKARVRDPRYELKVWFVEEERIYGALRRRDHSKHGFPWVLCTWRCDGGYHRRWRKPHMWDLVEHL